MTQGHPWLPLVSVVCAGIIAVSWSPISSDRPVVSFALALGAVLMFCGTVFYFRGPFLVGVALVQFACLWSAWELLICGPSWGHRLAGATIYGMLAWGVSVSAAYAKVHGLR